jgi:multisubunit Na+/H+ antiporter MnhE subunit
MTTLGDVFSIVAAILGSFLTLWAAVVAAGLLFPGATERARFAFEEPSRTLVRGLIVALTLGVLAFVMFAGPLPLFKGLGLLLLFWLFALSILGTAGVSAAVGRRIQDLDPGMAAYPATVRGAAFIVGGTLLPILGWFAFAPVLFVASLGAGWKAVVAPVRREAPEVV